MRAKGSGTSLAPAILISELDGVGGQSHAAAFWRNNGTHCMGGWLGPKPSLDM